MAVTMCLVNTPPVHPLRPCMNVSPGYANEYNFQFYKQYMHQTSKKHCFSEHRRAVTGIQWDPATLSGACPDPRLLCQGDHRHGHHIIYRIWVLSWRSSCFFLCLPCFCCPQQRSTFTLFHFWKHIIYYYDLKINAVHERLLEHVKYFFYYDCYQWGDGSFQGYRAYCSGMALWHHII